MLQDCLQPSGGQTPKLHSKLHSGTETTQFQIPQMTKPHALVLQQEISERSEVALSTFEEILSPLYLKPSLTWLGPDFPRLLPLQSSIIGKTQNPA